MLTSLNAATCRARERAGLPRKCQFYFQRDAMLRSFGVGPNRDFGWHGGAQRRAGCWTA